MDFDKRHVVITGGTGALGSAVVGALLGNGAVCHVPTKSDASARSFPHRSHPNVRLVTTGSLSDEAGVDKLYGGVPALWASIHLAGGYAASKITETDKTALMQQIELNFVTCFLCCRAAVRTMTSNGAGGRIVNVAARPAIEPRSGAGSIAYAATKAGVAALTEALAEEVAKEGILVNAVVPSIVDTPANRTAMPKAHFENWPKVEEVAETIMFLASPENRVGRGELVPVYGRS